jgi:hypothetical protein
MSLSPENVFTSYGCPRSSFHYTRLNLEITCRDHTANCRLFPRSTFTTTPPFILFRGGTLRFMPLLGTVTGLNAFRGRRSRKLILTMISLAPHCIHTRACRLAGLLFRESQGPSCFASCYRSTSDSIRSHHHVTCDTRNHGDSTDDMAGCCAAPGEHRSTTFEQSVTWCPNLED